MQVSAEKRWFWRGSDHSDLFDWFKDPIRHGCPASEGALRIDLYLADALVPELGIKRRGGKDGVEVKGLVSRTQESEPDGPFAGPSEIWCKWTTSPWANGYGRFIEVRKRRWQRKFDTSGSELVEIPQGLDERPLNGVVLSMGCGFEFTFVEVPGQEPWVSLGFEAFGALETVADSLTRTIALFADRSPTVVFGGEMESYPSWLHKYGPKSVSSA